MKYVLIFVLGMLCTCIILATSEGCEGANVRRIEQAYPGCQLMKASRLEKNMVEVILQCGPLPKVIKLKESEIK